MTITEYNNRRNNIMGKIIGIDLGTTNSCVAVMEGNKPTVGTVVKFRHYESIGRLSL